MGFGTAALSPVFLASQDASTDFMIQSYVDYSFFGHTVSICTTHVTTIIVMAVILIFALIARRSVLKGDPDAPSGFQNVVELLIEFLDGVVTNNMGTHSRKYANYILTLMIFIFLSNISGLFGLRPPTADYAVTIGLAVITFILIQYAAIKTSKLGAFTDLFKPLPFLFPINLIGELATPLSLSLRLFGNMLAGTIMLGLYYGLLPWFAKLGIPVALHGYFDLFSGAIQTYVFSMLTMVFITQKLDADA
ncbi:MAG: F0F1 ATP synthase subunit A [Lachnospiraceae bacterium]|nr:F0F1 ATP synthase subunit A [Lachnospiraceae bacterium]